MAKKIDEEVLNEIGRLAVRLDDSLFMLKTGARLSSEIHIEGLSGTMRDVRDELAKIYEESGGDEKLNIQA